MTGERGIRPGWRWLMVTLAAAIVALAGVRSAAAHADLISADPAPGSTVAGSPQAIRLSFSQPLLSTSRIDLLTGQFQAMPGLTTVVAGSELRGVPSQPLAPATYTVQWTAVSDDGHSTQGSYQFGVAPASSPVTGRVGALVAAAATILSGGVAMFVWILKRRQRV
jgi:methionine-rich copper-binding protein CopC